MRTASNGAVFFILILIFFFTFEINFEAMYTELLILGLFVCVFILISRFLQKSKVYQFIVLLSLPVLLSFLFLFSNFDNFAIKPVYLILIFLIGYSFRALAFYNKYLKKLN